MHHVRHWMVVIVALVVIGFGLVACDRPYSPPGGGGTPAPTSSSSGY
ncbi:MAG TPA: hypothetical protein VFX24_04540 [Ktedonobacterales bacterium]|nr:hypothetical protein [Ktedonobacterales bacterium]